MNDLNRSDAPSYPESQGKDALAVACPYALPFVIFMVFTSFEQTIAGSADKPGILDYEWFPAVYLLKIILTGLCLLYFYPIWKPLCRRLSCWGLLAGVAGSVVWISLSQLSLNSANSIPGKTSETEAAAAESINNKNTANQETDNRNTINRDSESWRSIVRWLFPSRVGFNPFEAQPNNPLWAWAFFVVRMTGLILIVPIMEELFLRGLAFRYVCAENWETVSFGTVCPMVWILSVLYPVMTHPELLAGIVWFTGMTVLAWKTKSLTDCIVAHALTNAALGFWVLYSGQWALL